MNQIPYMMNTNKIDRVEALDDNMVGSSYVWACIGYDD